MKFTYITLFPEIIEGFFSNSIIKRAVEQGRIDYHVVQLRDFVPNNSHHACDDAPYGGGAGMLLKSEPLALALESVNVRHKLCIYPSACGYPLQQRTSMVLSHLGQLENDEFLARLKNSVENMKDFDSLNTSIKFSSENKIDSEIVFICGRYEGIDQRIITEYVDLELSIGDYVLSSGELGSLCITDTIYRLCKGVIREQSLDLESFSSYLLEYPQYTRPEYFYGQQVPEILFSGHHEKIRFWRLERSIQRTLERRPELLQRAQRDGTLNSEVWAILQDMITAQNNMQDLQETRTGIETDTSE